MGLFSKIGKAIGITGGGDKYAGLAGEDYNQLDKMISAMDARRRGDYDSLAQKQMDRGLASAQKKMAGAMASNRSLTPAEQARLVSTQGEQLMSGELAESGELRAKEEALATDAWQKAIADKMRFKLGSKAQKQQAEQYRAGATLGAISGIARAATGSGKGGGGAA